MRDLSAIVRDLRALPPGQALRFISMRLGKKRRHRRQEQEGMRKIQAVRADLRSALLWEGSLESYAEVIFDRLEGFPLDAARREAVAGHLREKCPEWKARCLREAERVLQNRVRLLGHECELGDTVRWFRDHVAGADWVSGRWTEAEEKEPEHGPDIKFIWELSRFHQGVTLGRAYAITGEERYAEKFVALFRDWHRENGACEGPNWLCAMEVAIRAVNLLWCVALMSRSQALRGAVVRQELITSLICHGISIFHHREYDERVVGNRLKPVNGNHYLSDLVGLIFLGTALPQCRYAAEWRSFGEKEFFRELEWQVDDDGVNWEYSPNYHRLVSELVICTLILLERDGVKMSEGTRAKVGKMLDWMWHYRLPSGGFPAVRDVDNGRLCVLGGEELECHDHMLELGAKWLGLDRYHPGAAFEDTLWWLGVEVVGAGGPGQDVLGVGRSAVRLPGSRHFEKSGFVVLRGGSDYLLVVACPKGMEGYCGHTHNDFLSFELESMGRRFLVDPGSYVYGRSRAWRNRMRGTSSHNTLWIDGREQNAFPSGDLFEIGAAVKPRVLEWRQGESRDVFEGEYVMEGGVGADGKVWGRVVHRRRIVWVKDVVGGGGMWLFRDRVEGEEGGTHRVEARFHCAPKVDMRRVQLGVFATSSQGGVGMEMRFQDGEGWGMELEEGWGSWVYGKREKIQVLKVSGERMFPVDLVYVIRVGEVARGEVDWEWVVEELGAKVR